MIRLALLVVMLISFLVKEADAQCPIRPLFGSIVPTSSWQAINWGRGGEGQVFNADSGCVYQFSYCVTDGGYAPFDTEITIYDGTTQLYAGGYNDDFAGCGTGSKITWVAPRTGPFRIQTDKKPCATDTRLVTLAFRRLACPPPSCNYAQTDVCIFDATGGLGNCLFVGDLCSDGFQFGGMVRNSSPFQINELQRLDSIRFRIYTSGCPPGASQGFYFYLNNQLIGTLPLGANDCLCAAQDFPRTVVFSGSNIRAAWNHCGPNILGVSANNDPNYAVSGYTARLFYTNKPPAPPPVTLATQLCGPNSVSVLPAPCGRTYYWQLTSCDTLRSFPASVPYTALTPGIYRVRTENSFLPGCWSDSCSAQEVFAPVQGNTLTPSQTICAGTIPALLTGATLSGGFGTYVYSWESSPDSLTWSGIAGETLSDYQPPVTAQPVWYRRWVVAGCSTASAGVRVVPEDSITGNLIGNSQTLCELTLPTLLTGAIPSGGTQPFSWQWLASSDSVNWNPVSGGSGASYSPGLQNSPVWFARVAAAGVCPPDTSPPVYLFPEPVIGNNTLIPQQTLCAGGIPAILSGSAPSGGIGNYQYQWESSPDLSVWQPIPGETGSDYQSPSLLQTTYFRRWVTSGLCPALVSDTLRVWVEQPLGSNQIGADQTLCEFVAGNTLTGTIPTGGTGGYLFTWQSSPDGTNWFSNGNTNSSQPVTGEGFRIWYRRIVQSGICPEDTSAVVEIYSLPGIQNNTTGGDQTLCTGTTPPIAGSQPSAGSGAYVYQWQSALSIPAWSNIPGETNRTYQSPPLSQSVYFRRIVTSAFCTDTSAASYWQAITVVSPNQIGVNQTICGNSLPAALTGPVPTGGGLLTWQWQQSSDNTSWTDISGETQSSYSPTALNQSTWFRRILFSQTCLPLTTQSVQIVWLPALTGNLVSASQTICYNALPTLLSGTQPSGGNGVYSYFWEQSTDSIAWAIPSGGISVQFQPGLLTGSTYFRRTVLSLFCTPLVSNVIRTDLEQAIGNNQIGVAQTICAGSSFQPVTGSTPSGGNGVYSYIWQSSVNLSLWSFAGNQANLPPAVLSSPTWLRRVVNGGSCPGDTSAYINVFVQDVITGNTIGNAQTICETQTPALLTGSIPSGGDGLYVYQWETSIDDQNWLHLPGTFQQDYQPPQVLQSVYYRRIAWSGLCPASTSASVWIRSDRAIGDNRIGADQTICMGFGANPLTGVIPTGGTFSFQYLWQTSPDGLIWQAGAVPNQNPGYTVGTPLQSLWLRRIVSSGVCAPSTSNVARIEVLQRISANQIFGDQTLCNTSPPVLLTGSFPAGADGQFIYQWEMSANGMLWQNAGGNDQVQDYAASVLTGRWYFRRWVHNAYCPSVISNLVSVRSDAPIQADSLTPAQQQICYSDAPQVIRSGPHAGGISQVVYTWEGSPDGITWGYTDSTEYLQPPALANTQYYRRIIASGACLPDTSSTVMVEAQLPLGDNTIASSQTLCLGMPSGVLTGMQPTGGTGAYSYLWESSSDGSTWIGAGNTQQLDPGTLYQSIQVRRTVASGVCPALVSNTLSIVIHPLPANNMIGSNQTICGGQTPVMLTGSIPQGGGGVYAFEWQSSNGSTWSQIPGGFQQHYQPPLLFTPTRYRRIVTSGPCAPDISDVVLIHVLPKPALTVDSDTICEGEQAVLTAWTNVPGGSFNWLPGNETTQSIWVSPTASSGYSVQYVVNGCSAIPAGASVTVVPLPPALLSWPGSEIICVGGSKMLTINSQGGPYSYLWNTGATSQTLLATQPGKYSVTVMNAQGCRRTASVDIRYASPPLFADAPAVPGLCPENNSQRITVTPVGGVAPYSVSWSPTTGLTGANEFSPLVTVSGNKTYTATVTDQIGCVSQASVTVGLHPPVMASFSVERLSGDTLYFPDSLRLTNTSLNAQDCFWELGEGYNAALCQPQTRSLIEEGPYTLKLMVISPEGCRDSVRKTIWYRTQPTLAYPTAFSPNGDGFNDFFRIPSLNVNNMTVWIFDRWGNTIITSQNPEFTWDGMMNGNPVPEGAYMIRVSGLGLHGEPIEYQGTITVIR